jgi:drug/metabolite transporter (DMT)-like permease
MLGLQWRCLAWTLGSLYAQSVPKKLPLASAAGIEMVAGSIALFLLSRVFSKTPRACRDVLAGWGAFVYLIIFGSLVGFTAFAYCLNELPATTVGTYAYVNPVVAVFLGWLILGEVAHARPARRRCADRAVGGADDAAQALIDDLAFRYPSA